MITRVRFNLSILSSDENEKEHIEIIKEAIKELRKRYDPKFDVSKLRYHISRDDSKKKSPTLIESFN